MSGRHGFRPTFVRPGCAFCGHGRDHPIHGDGPIPTLHCGECGQDVPLPQIGAHLIRHGIFSCGGDPWRMTQQGVDVLLDLRAATARKGDS